MTDAATGRIKIKAVLAGEGFDLGVLGKIFRARVLHVVIEREDGLARIADFFRADALEFGNDRAGVVMRQNVRGTNGKIISAADDVSVFQPDGVALGDFFDESWGMG